MQLVWRWRSKCSQWNGSPQPRHHPPNTQYHPKPLHTHPPSTAVFSLSLSTLTASRRKKIDKCYVCCWLMDSSGHQRPPSQREGEKGPRPPRRLGHKAPKVRAEPEKGPPARIWPGESEPGRDTTGPPPLGGVLTFFTVKWVCCHHGSKVAPTRIEATLKKTRGTCRAHLPRALKPKVHLMSGPFKNAFQPRSSLRG